MVKITYIDSEGCDHAVEVEPGLSLMEAAKNNDVEGILADCGGTCACGTCRVYIDEPWRSKVGAASELESATIEAHEDPVPGCRLSCQISVTNDLQGMVVRMPKSQF